MLRKTNHSPEAPGRTRSQVTQVAPVGRGFWVKPGAPCLGAPPLLRHASEPQAGRTREQPRPRAQASVSPQQTAGAPTGTVCPSPLPQAGGLRGLRHKGLRLGPQSPSTQLRRFLREAGRWAEA